MPHEAGFNTSDNPYSNEGFFKICKDYEVSQDPMKYRDEKLFGTHQQGGWSDYINPNSMTCWIIENSQRFTDMGLLRISESVRAYAYMVLSSQASVRPSIIGNTVNALNAQKAFLNNFANVVSMRVDIQEGIK